MTKPSRKPGLNILKRIQVLFSDLFTRTQSNYQQASDGAQSISPDIRIISRVELFKYIEDRIDKIPGNQLFEGEDISAEDSFDTDSLYTDSLYSGTTNNNTNNLTLSENTLNGSLIDTLYTFSSLAIKDKVESIIDDAYAIAKPKPNASVLKSTLAMKISFTKKNHDWQEIDRHVNNEYQEIQNLEDVPKYRIDSILKYLDMLKSTRI